MGKIKGEQSSSNDSTMGKKMRIQRGWKQAEEDRIVKYLLTTVRSGQTIEKPTGDVYFGLMLPLVKIENCSVSQLRNKVRNMKRKYVQTVAWRNEAGQGVLETDPPAFERKTEAMCPNFKILDEIFGTETNNIHSPFTVDVDVPHELGARNWKSQADGRKLDFEEQKLNFEKLKWSGEYELRKRELELEEKRLAAEESNARYEIEMKYKTQLEIAKLQFVVQKP